jgi:hypothetical protein
MNRGSASVEELVKEWLSLDRKRNLRSAAYTWLRIAKETQTSLPDGEAGCPEEQKPATKP